MRHWHWGKNTLSICHIHTHNQSIIELYLITIIDTLFNRGSSFHLKGICRCVHNPFVSVSPPQEQSQIHTGQQTIYRKKGPSATTKIYIFYRKKVLVLVIWYVCSQIMMKWLLLAGLFSTCHVWGVSKIMTLFCVFSQKRNRLTRSLAFSKIALRAAEGYAKLRVVMVAGG